MVGDRATTADMQHHRSRPALETPSAARKPQDCLTHKNMLKVVYE